MQTNQAGEQNKNSKWLDGLWNQSFYRAAWNADAV